MSQWRGYSLSATPDTASEIVVSNSNITNHDSVKRIDLRLWKHTLFSELKLKTGHHIS